MSGGSKGKTFSSINIKVKNKKNEPKTESKIKINLGNGIGNQSKFKKPSSLATKTINKAQKTTRKNVLDQFADSDSDSEDILFENDTKTKDKPLPISKEALSVDVDLVSTVKSSTQASDLNTGIKTPITATSIDVIDQPPTKRVRKDIQKSPIKEKKDTILIENILKSEENVSENVDAKSNNDEIIKMSKTDTLQKTSFPMIPRSFLSNNLDDKESKVARISSTIPTESEKLVKTNSKAVDNRIRELYSIPKSEPITIVNWEGKNKKEDNMIKDDNNDDLFDDMFSESPIMESEIKLNNQIEVNNKVKGFVDTDNYYKPTIGEFLNQSYIVIKNLGSGVFSTVVEVQCTYGDNKGTHYAIKISKNDEIIRKAVEKEIIILEKLTYSNSNSGFCIVKYFESFEYNGHLCLVFEKLDCNIREFMSSRHILTRILKDGTCVGTNMDLFLLRKFARQLFNAISLVHKCELIHSDIKPDNILINESKMLSKIADFGSASGISDNDATPYLVSRFYRAPEIILGVPYTPAIDIWSLCCTLYELFTGCILFPGKDNNEMLRLIQELKGGIPKKMIKKGSFYKEHFQPDGTIFIDSSNSSNNINITGKPIAFQVGKPKLDIITKLRRYSNNIPEDCRSLLYNFAKFLDRGLTLIPEQRLTIKEALSDPFLA